MTTERYKKLMDLAETDPMKATEEFVKYIKGVEHPEAEFGGEEAMRNLADRIAMFRSEFKFRKALDESIGSVLCRSRKGLAVMHYLDLAARTSSVSLHRCDDADNPLPRQTKEKPSMSHEIPPLESLDNGKALAETVKRFRVEATENADAGIRKFTPNHKVWDVSLYMDGELVHRTNFQSCDEPKGGDVWQCIAQDAMACEETTDLADFLECFAFRDNADTIREGIAAYEGCKRTLEAFRDKGVDTRALAGLLNRAEAAEVLDVETTLN